MSAPVPGCRSVGLISGRPFANVLPRRRGGLVSNGALAVSSGRLDAGRVHAERPSHTPADDRPCCRGALSGTGPVGSDPTFAVAHHHISIVRDGSGQRPQSQATQTNATRSVVAMAVPTWISGPAGPIGAGGLGGRSAHRRLGTACADHSERAIPAGRDDRAKAHPGDHLSDLFVGACAAAPEQTFHPAERR
jgi:hypothetical protein